MPQSTLTLTNITFPTARPFINGAFDALATCSSGATEPPSMRAFMWWADTTAGIMKQRNSANNAWLNRWALTDGQLATVATLQATGWGVSALATAIADCDTLTTSGAYRANSSTTNTPIFGRFYTITHHAGADVNTVATQIAIDTNNGGEMYIRQRTAGGGWGAWRAISTRAYALGDSIRGNAPTFTSNTSITMPAGLECADSLRSTLIRVASSTVINFATTGLNGLDTGTIASNTWYYIHAILNPTTGATGYVASTSSTSPTMPSGFTIRRTLPFVVRTFIASATLVGFVMTHGLNFVRTRWYLGSDETIFNNTTGSATPFVVDASVALPPICNGANSRLIASVWQDTTASTTWSRISVDNTATGNWQTLSASPWVREDTYEIELYSATRQFRLRNDASGGGSAACNCQVYARGYVFNYLGVV